MRKIRPRPDLKKIKSLLNKNKSYREGIDNAIAPFGDDIIQEACNFHKIERRMVEQIKWVDDNTIILSLHAPSACKLRYERK